MKHTQLPTQLLLFALVLLSCALSTPLDACADTTEARVGKIRAAVVYYLVKFVRWENTEQRANKQELTICTVGEDLANNYLLPTVTGKQVDKRNIHVAQGANGSIDPNCDLVFFGSDAVSQLPTLAPKLAETKALVVCAVKSITWGKCMIQLYEEKNRIKVAIDQQLVQNAHFKISSELLNVSTLRDPTEEE